MRIVEIAENLKKHNPCWAGYRPIGTKKKNGRAVPNCVPGKKGSTNEAQGIPVKRSGPNETVVTA